MKGLLFGVEPTEIAGDLPATPMDLVDLDEPQLPGDDWVVLRTRLCGICGSDAKQVLLDGEPDNAMTALISFPQVLGHEIVGTVERAGPASSVEVGQRVVLDPWLTCAPRGISPVCAACADGDLALCHHFTEGRLAPGIHTGNSADATGGFAELVPAHDSMCHVVPDDVADEVAVLADPFAVSLHAVTRNPPPDGGTALVYGVGALGTTTLEILRALHPGVRVGAVTQFEQQRRVAADRGATTFHALPVGDLVPAVAEWSGGILRAPLLGLPFTHPGGVDVIYDTVGSPETLEVGVRVTRPRGSIVITGVATPGRFEWTPWYFKELRLVGSNAFGVEEVGGIRQHAIDHYLELARRGRIDLAGMLTHTFPIDDWRRAFEVLADRERSEAIKVAFDFR